MMKTMINNIYIQTASLRSLSEDGKINFDITFDEAHSKNGIFAITGSNGSGKSMLLDIIKTSTVDGAIIQKYNGILKESVVEYGYSEKVRFQYKGSTRKFLRISDHNFTKLSIPVKCVDNLNSFNLIELTQLLYSHFTLSDNFITKINKWFEIFEMPHIKFYNAQDTGFCFCRYKGIILNRDIICNCLSSSERKILSIVENIIFCHCNPEYNVYIDDNIDIYFSLVIQNKLVEFLSDIKPKKLQIIFSAHSPVTFGFDYNWCYDLNDLNKRYNEQKDR